MLVFVEDDREVDFREGNARWVVTLSNGQKVYDNNRENVSTWVELHDYCYTNGLYITDMYVHFRSNHYHLPSNKDGYFFSKLVLGGLLEESNSYSFLLGYEENDSIIVHKIRVPDLTLQTIENRDPSNMNYQLISKNYFGLPKRKYETAPNR